MISNLENVLPANAKIAFDGGTINPAQAVTELEGGVKAITDAASAKVAFVGATQAKKVAMVKLHLVTGAVAMYLKATITDPGQLASCGIHAAKKRAKLTAAEQAAKSAKARATRAANKTQGAAQKRKAALAASATTVVIGANGQPIGGPALPTPATGAGGAAVAK